MARWLHPRSLRLTPPQQHLPQPCGHPPSHSLTSASAILFPLSRSLPAASRRCHTGFEETKDFPIRMNDLIAGRYQVCTCVCVFVRVCMSVYVRKRGEESRCRPRWLNCLLSLHYVMNITCLVRLWTLRRMALLGPPAPVPPTKHFQSVLSASA